MVYVILDIETIAHPDAHKWLEPVKPDARLVDPVKIEASITERTADRDSALALDPDCNRIVAFGYYVVGSLGDPQCLLARDEFEEREHLKNFADIYRQLDRRNEVKLVTFNGLAFDLRVIKRRAVWLDLREFPKWNLDKYRSPHADTDVMWQLSDKGAGKPHSLKFYAKRAGLELYDKVNGSEIAQLVKDENWEAVQAHCLADVGLTHALANRIGLLQVTAS